LQSFENVGAAESIRALDDQSAVRAQPTGKQAMHFMERLVVAEINDLQK
jgi:hypothetical protein